MKDFDSELEKLTAGRNDYINKSLCFYPKELRLKSKKGEVGKLCRLGQHN